jgi:hypothetical protein
MPAFIWALNPRVMAGGHLMAVHDPSACTRVDKSSIARGCHPPQSQGRSTGQRLALPRVKYRDLGLSRRDEYPRGLGDLSGEPIVDDDMYLYLSRGQGMYGRPSLSVGSSYVQSSPGFATIVRPPHPVLQTGLSVDLPTHYQLIAIHRDAVNMRPARSVRRFATPQLFGPLYDSQDCPSSHVRDECLESQWHCGRVIAVAAATSTASEASGCLQRRARQRPALFVNQFSTQAGCR